MKALLTALLMVTALQVRAQCPSNKRQLDIAVGYGLLTGKDVFGEIKPDESTVPGVKSRTYYSGARTASIRYFLFNRLALGFTGAMATERGEYRSGGVAISRYEQSTTTIALECYYIYKFGKRFEIYTLLGAGPSFSTATTDATPSFGWERVDKTEKFKAQYTPVGVRVGGRFGVFAELGIGYKGIVNLGASFKLGPSCWWRN